MEPTALMLRVCELLDDGDWHDLEHVYREAGKTIPPGRAIRSAEYNRAKVRNAPAHRVKTRSNDQLITYGRRRIIYELLRHASFETRQGPDGGRVVRMIQPPGQVQRYRQETHG